MGLSRWRIDPSFGQPKGIQTWMDLRGRIGCFHRRKHWKSRKEKEMRGFEKVSRGLAGCENWVMIVGMGLASFLITLQVILRYFLNYSISWGEELTRYAIVWMSFVGAGMGIRKGAHICVDLLIVFLSERWKRALTSLMAIVGAGFGMAIFVTGCNLVYSGIERGQVSPALEVPIFIVYLAVPLGGLIMMFRWLELFLSTFKGFFPQVEVERKGGM